jgi:hypothetical protein
MTQMPQGQVSRQKPQPIHFSGSDIYSYPTSVGTSRREMAVVGHMVSQRWQQEENG